MDENPRFHHAAQSEGEEGEKTQAFSIYDTAVKFGLCTGRREL
jgi:hypothetical protein